MEEISACVRLERGLIGEIRPLICQVTNSRGMLVIWVLGTDHIFAVALPRCP